MSASRSGKKSCRSTSGRRSRIARSTFRERQLISAKMKTLGLILFITCAALGSLRAETTEIEIVPADPAVYGEFPQKYQEIVTQWLNKALVDAASAKIEWVSSPTPGSLPEKKNGK